MDDTRIILGEVTAHIYTSSLDGDIELIELYTDRQTDPAEIYFDDTPQDSNQHFPGRVRLQYGLETRLVIQIEGLESKAYISPATETGAQP